MSQPPETSTASTTAPTAGGHPLTEGRTQRLSASIPEVASFSVAVPQWAMPMLSSLDDRAGGGAEPPAVIYKDAPKSIAGGGGDQASRLRALAAGDGGDGSSRDELEAWSAAAGIGPAARVDRFERTDRTERVEVAARAVVVPPSTAPASVPAPIIAIASGKGGVGKTNLAVNLAAAMSARGLRTTLLDADLGTANCDVLCGVRAASRLDSIMFATEADRATEDGFGLDAPRRPRSVRDIAVRCPGGFTLIPGATGVPRAADLAPAQVAALLRAMDDLDTLSDGSDVVIVDLGAGVSSAVTRLLAAADLGIVVATPEPASITDAYALIKCLTIAERERWGGTAAGEGGSGGGGQAATDRLTLVINQAASEEEARQTYGRIASTAERFLCAQLPMLGWIAQDPRVPAAVRACRPFFVDAPTSPAAQGVRRIASAAAQRLGELSGAGRAVAFSADRAGEGVFGSGASGAERHPGGGGRKPRGGLGAWMRAMLGTRVGVSHP